MILLLYTTLGSIWEHLEGIKHVYTDVYTARGGVCERSGGCCMSGV